MTGILLAVETVVLVLLTILVAGLLRSHAEILKRLHALGAGLDDAPATASSSPVTLRASSDGFGAAFDIEGSGLRNDAMHISIVGTRHQTLLAFLSSGCLTCHGFWETFRDTHALELPDDLRLVVVAKDASDDSITELRRLAPPHLPVVMSSAAWESYSVPGSPYFVLVDGPDARIRGEGTGTSWEQVWNLLRQAAGDDRARLIDDTLLAHGIAPGDPSLYQTAELRTRAERP